MFATVLDWFERKAIRLDSAYGSIQPKWVSWIRFPTKDDRGYQFDLYMLVIRLPSYPWGYMINTDTMGWRQNAIIWRSRRISDYAPPKGWSIREIDPI